MNLSIFKRVFCGIAAVFLFVAGIPVLAAAGAKVKIDDTKYFQIGMGFRGDVSLNENTTTNDTDPGENSFDINHFFRLYTVSQVHKNVQVEYNTRLTGESVNLLDAVAKLQFDGFEFWIGRQLPPSDRSNLDGPNYLNAAYHFPIVQSFGILGAGCCGRDDGFAFHGDVDGG